MAKKRVHYVKIKVVFDKPIGQRNAVSMALEHLSGEEFFFNLLDAAETGAGSFKISGAAAVAA